MSLQTLLLFAPISFTISLSPGLCMMLALNTGMRVGVRNGWPMVVGELLGVALVATTSVSLIAALIHTNPEYFEALKIAAAVWLLYSAWLSFKSDKVNTKVKDIAQTRQSLALQGFLTAIGNPKGWAFTAAFLPPFIDQTANLAPQLAALVAVLLLGELICLYLYMFGGRTLSKWLEQQGRAQSMGAITGTLLVGLALWLLLA